MLDAKELWRDVLKGAKTELVGLSRIYGAVMAETEEVVGKLTNLEIKAIAQALPGRDRVNRLFDVLGVPYVKGRCLRLMKESIRE